MSHALALLANYSDDEESEKETEKSLSPPTKKKKIILENPLKNIKFGNTTSEPEFEDDPSLHENRVRSFPHIRGNWASFIFIDPLKQIDFNPLTKSILKFLSSSQNSSKVEYKAFSEQHHLSVSRVFTLQHHWISSFIQSFQTKLKNFVKPITLSLAPKVDILVNEDFSRTFITVAIAEHKGLTDIVQCCDETLVEFDKDIFYKPPNFHISLVWALGDQRKQIDVKGLQNCFDAVEESTFHVNNIHCKIGNKLFTNKL